MKCKKCKMEIDDQSIFCSYCGDRVESNDGYVDPFEKYRVQDSHDMQYQYQQSYSNGEDNKKMDNLQAVQTSGFLSLKSYTMVGIILSILSVIACFFHVGVGITLLVLAFFFIIRGFQYAKKGRRIASILTLVFSTFAVVVVSIVLWIFSWTITLENGMQYTIKEYLLSTLFNSFYSDHVYGMWMDESGEVLDLTGGFYYTFYDSNGDTLYEGAYSKMEGYLVGVDDYVYSDRDFYFFQFVEESGDLTNGDTLVLCLDKKDFTRMVLYFPERKLSVETKKIDVLPYKNKNEKEKEEIAPGIIG